MHDQGSTGGGRSLAKRMFPSPNTGQLRFLTCGSVDDGKSTLIGRLLFDCRMIYEDQLAALAADASRFGTTAPGELDLALLVDGLEAEREQVHPYLTEQVQDYIIDAVRDSLRSLRKGRNVG